MAPSASQFVVVCNTLYGLQGQLGIETKRELVTRAVRNGVVDDSDVGR